MGLNSLRIAFIKQDVYQDLYVCSSEEQDASKILFSSQGRVGPIGLMAELNADFYIIQEEPDWETQIYRKVVPKRIAKYLYLLKDHTLNQIPGQEFKIPGTTDVHNQYSVKADAIDWGKYDIVLSVNVTLPTRIVLQYPHTLFAYMIGEANAISSRVGFGYDVSCNQLARGIVSEKVGKTIDFPYTFVKGTTLQNLMEQSLKRKSANQGVFMEINSTLERPVTKAPAHFQPLLDKGYEILLHEQRIQDNLTKIFDAKYFVKMGGRTIRGNSVIEAISLGTLVLMDRKEIIHHELIPDECHVETMAQLVSRIEMLEKNPDEYQRLLQKQQGLVTDLVFNKPLETLQNCLKDKRRSTKPTCYSFWNRLVDHIAFFHLK